MSKPDANAEWLDGPRELSFVPAPVGWVAVYEGGCCEPLVGWAVVEIVEAGCRWREVRPMVVGDGPHFSAVCACDCSDLVGVQYRGPDAASLYAAGGGPMVQP